MLTKASSGDMCESLSDQILDALVTSKFDTPDRRFIPDGVINDLIDESSIIKALSEGQQTPYNCHEPSTKLLIDFILAKARKVFGIVIRIGIPAHHLRDAVELLQIAGISDESLPAQDSMWNESTKTLIPPKVETDSAASYRDAGHLKNEANTDGSLTEHPIHLSKVWKKARIIDFCEQQWSFLAPVFSRRKFTYDLKPSSILPFVDKHFKCDSGAFGLVSQFEIHNSHLVDEHDPEFRCPQYVAIKELQPRDQEDRKRIVNTWGQEARALQKMNLLYQPHIVQFHTSFRRGDPGAQKHYLVLEWANGGNLRNLWKNFHRPALSSELVKATVYQLLGLAKAINKAHYPETGPNFRHGDLKPENILWFKDESGDGIGTLKIGDWGTAKQHFRVTEMRSNRTTSKWGTRRYEPPEEACCQGTSLFIPGQSGKKRSRLYDIWALGCITLEFLIWLMYGREERDRFDRGIAIDNADNTRFYLIKPGDDGNPTATVHDVAAAWMDHMAKDPICAPGSTALGSLLEIVQTRLLVVKLPERLASWIDPCNTMPENDARINSSSSTFSLPEADPDIYTSIPNSTSDEAEPSAIPVSQNVSSNPVPKAPGRRGWERARASELLDRLLEIESDHMMEVAGKDDESYWFTGQPNPPKGPDIDDIRRNIQSLVVQGLSVGNGERVSIA